MGFVCVFVLCCVVLTEEREKRRYRVNVNNKQTEILVDWMMELKKVCVCVCVCKVYLVKKSNNIIIS